MKYSELFGKTLRETPKDATTISHKLLYQAGFIRESTAGRYYFLPLGWRTHEKIKAIIKKEMDEAGAQEMIAPVLHPLELWKETNRTNTTGFELLKIKDHGGFEFALGGTAEEMFVELIRKFKLSYRDLPFNIYQFSTKFRDEKRPRGGLLRLREFVMKDAYSFDRNEEEFRKTYATMANAYSSLFTKLGLKTLKVEADNGYIGGEYCHEYQVENPIGEGRFFVAEDGSYAAHADIAKFKRDDKNVDEELKPYTIVDARRGTTMEDGVALHHLPMWHQLKDFLAVNEKGKFILAVTRGDYDINEIKLAKVTQSIQLRHATDEEIRKLGSEPGFISPVGLEGKVLIVGDISLRTIHNAYGGANALHKDAVNINIDRDYSLDIEADISMAQAGMSTQDGKSKLIEKRGIEVGNIFQLGYHYTHLMKGANFVDADGKEKPYYMGCYGIGLARTMAAIVEMHHDDRGIVWPKEVAPFAVHLVTLTGGEVTGKNLYKTLSDKGIEVLWDDRDVAAGVKFADADLIGIPVRLVVSAKTGDEVEYKERDKRESKLVSLKDMLDLLK